MGVIKEADIATRRAILDAAARTAVRSGYGETTMRGIAQEAGLSAASLYNYFEGKREIFDALREECHRSVLEAMGRPMPSGLTFPQRLELMMMRTGEVVLARLEGFIFVANLSSPGESDESLRVQGEFLDSLVAWFESNAAKGDLGECSVEDAAYFFFGVQHGAFAQWLRGGGGTPLLDQIPKIVRLVTRGLS